jgi:hypothetical protein
MSTAAYHSPEPVLNNRFVRVFYFRPPPTNIGAQRGAMIGPRGRGGMRGGARGGHVHNVRPEGAETIEPFTDQTEESLDPDAMGDLKRTVNNIAVEEPKIVEEARNKQKEKRSLAVEQEIVKISRTLL